MPTAPTYPGVYIEEIPSGVRTITGVPTSITAFVGRTRKGPDNDPITINSYGDFERRFGGLWKESRLGFSVRDFYLNGGSQAIIVRLEEGATAASITIPETSPPADQLILDAASPGTWGRNLRALINHETKDPTNTNLFNIIVYEVDEEENVLLSEEHVNVSTDSNDPRYLTRVLKERSNLVRVQTIGATRPDETEKEKTPATSPPTFEPDPVPGTGGSDGSDLDKDSFIGAGLEGCRGC